MIKSIIVVDDFYDNPHEKRSFALEQEYNVTGNYPAVSYTHLTLPTKA